MMLRTPASLKLCVSIPISWVLSDALTLAAWWDICFKRTPFATNLCISLSRADVHVVGHL